MRLNVSGQAAAGVADVPSVLDLGLAVDGATAKAALAQAAGQPVALATTIDLDHATSATAAADLRLRMRVVQGTDVPSEPVVREVDGDASGLSTAVEVVAPLTAPAADDGSQGTADAGAQGDERTSQGHDSGSVEDEGPCDGDGDADDVGCPPADPAPPAATTPDPTPAPLPDVEVRLPVAATPDAGEPATPTSGTTASVPATSSGSDPSSPDPTPAPDLSLQVGVIVTPSSPSDPVTAPPATTDPATTGPATTDPVAPADPEPTTASGSDQPAGADHS